MDYFSSLINSYLPEPHASLLNGILFGTPLKNVTNNFYNNLKLVGLIHIVVLSGMNITLLSAVVLNMLVPMIGRRYAMIATIIIILIFVYFVGIEPPVVRAATMGILSLVGLLFGRKTLALYTLFLTSVILIIIFPEWLKSISFQLSFGATLGIILFGNVSSEEEKPPLNPLLSKEGNQRGGGNSHGQKSVIGNLKSYLLEELRISLAAQIFTVPIIFFYFRQISFIAPLANLMVAWMIAPIMIFGMITVVVGLVWWQGGFVLSWLSYGLLSIIVFVVEWFAKIPYASVKLI